MKKRNAILLATFTAVILFSACKKSDPAPPSDPAYVGLWKGKYGNGTTVYPTSGYAFLFRNNGTVRVFNSADTTAATKAEGTFTISGTTINTTYNYIGGGGTYSTTATMDSKNTFQEGTWGSGTNTTNGGNFFIVKQ
jgi:hypothetical protein